MFLLFDIGGTNMRLAVSPDGKNFNEPRIVQTPRDFDDGVSFFAKIAVELSAGGRIKAAAGGIAGPLDREKTKLVNSPNLSGWIDKPLKETFQKAMNIPVYLENDAAVVGLGEAANGAGKGEEIVAYITVSTGVGGARIVDGKIDRNIFGFEPGHQIIDPDGTLCPACGGAGHLEGHVSGAALEARFKRKAHEITDAHVWEEEAKWLAYGLNNTIVYWSPSIVVLGGSMITKNPGMTIERISYHLKKTLVIFKELPRLAKAELGDVGGLHGALEILKQNNYS
ncbi:ROK family protein [Candidatus Wolfebacteria bacterium]|nr:ROK family protein [Candidatus Wolfebacteria bacterium]